MSNKTNAFEDNETVFLIEAKGAESFLNNPESSFIGRKNLLENFYSAISNAKEQGVSILVSGYRGTGKTLFVKKAIDEYKKKKSLKIWRIRLNLGANRHVSYRDVLHEILSEVNVRVSRSYYSSLAFVTLARIFALIVLLNFTLIFFYPSNIIDEIVFIFSFFVNSIVFFICGFKFIHFCIFNKFLSCRSGFFEVVLSFIPVFLMVVFLLSMVSSFYSNFYDPSPFFSYFFDFFKWIDFFFEGSFYLKWSVLDGWDEDLPLLFWFVVFSLFFIFISSEIFLYRLKNIKQEIKGLLENIESKTSVRQSLYNKFMVPYFSFGLFNEKKIEKNILSDSQVEARLASIIDTISKRGAAGLVSLENFDDKNKWDYRYDGFFSFFINVKKLRRNFFKRNKISLIFIFDELDKLDSIDAFVGDSNVFEKPNNAISKNVTEELLGSMKSLIKDSSATYIFISDREASDIYYSESGSKNALYQGVFDLVLNIPSLLLDDSDGSHNTLHSMISSYVIALMKVYVEDVGDDKSKEYPKIDDFHDYVRQGLLACSDTDYLTNSDKILQENIVYIVDRFIRYLTFHSAGNCRRLSTIMRQYITIFSQRDVQDNYVGRTRIDLGNEQSTYIILDANRINERVKSSSDDSYKKRYFLKFSLRDVSTFSMASSIYEAVQWKMGHELSNSDDKLVFSSFNALMDILKFHEIGFARHYLDRTSEAIDKFSEPHFPYVANDLLEQVLYPFLRKIRRGIFQYRFYSFVEEDIRYISKMSSIQSSVYNFGLNSFGAVKQHYLDFLKTMEGASESQSIVYSILGDINLWEKQLDEARSYYTKSLTIFESSMSNEVVPARVDVRYGKTLLKCGLVEATRNNHFVALGFYKKLLDYVLSVESKLTANALFYSGQVKDIQLRELYVHANNSINSINLKLGHTFKNIVPYGALVRRRDSVDKGLLLKCLSLEFSSNKHKNMSLNLNEYVKSTAEDVSNGSKDKEIYALIMIHIIWAQSTLITAFEDKNLINNYKPYEWYSLLETFMDFDILQCNHDFNAIVKSIINNQKKGMLVGVVRNVFRCLYCLSEKMSSLNYPIRAAFLLNNILTSWIALLELYPFSRMDRVRNQPSIIAFDPEWIKIVRKKLLRYSQQSTGGVFENNTVLWSSNIDGLNVLSPTYQNDLYSKDVNNEAKLNITKRYIYWNRNSLQMLSRMICFWEYHARHRLFDNDFGYSDFFIHEIIPVNHKSTSIHLWLRGRSRTLKLTEILKKYSRYLCICSTNYRTHIDKSVMYNRYPLYNKYFELMVLSCEAICDYYQSINLNRSFTVSGDPQTIPIKFGIAFQLYELLYNLSCCLSLDSLELQKCLIETQELANKNNHSRVLDVPSDYFNLHQMGKLAETEIRDLQAFGTLDSPTYRQSLRTRYYLYDDYEDPMFKIEWTYLNIAKLGVKSHLVCVERMRNNYKKRFNNEK